MKHWSIPLAAALASTPVISSAEQAALEDCKKISAVLSFCGETSGEDTSGWKSWPSKRDDEAIYYTMSLGDTATVVSTTKLPETGGLTLEQIAAKLATGPKSLHLTHGPLLTSYADSVDGRVAETRVYSDEVNKKPMVYVQTWFNTDDALVQIVTSAPASDPWTDWKAVHNAFLAATRYEAN
ncbi:hypothetical protein [Cypionkella sinensis]|uniref:Uncharacterized protein n=1 Tax=Cypionkella sinensis TaxID=1756043 RepID=A0ABV7J124_9RHOB